MLALLLLLGVACERPPNVSPADPVAVRGALVLDVADGALDLWRGPVEAGAGYTVGAVRFALRPGFDVAALLFTPDAPGPRGVLVAHGHYGQGKTAPEAQEIAHRLAARGATVLVVDTPGVEEWDVPGRHIHFDEGAHNRAWLAAAGGSAMGLQLAVLRRGLDVLESVGATRIAATGASGGAVQAFYLALIDPRVRGVALASFPPVPRGRRPGGCACDSLPGWPGPDPRLLASLSVPSLWMSEVAQPRPLGLPDDARFVVMEGDHSYTPAMQRAALDGMDDWIGPGRDVWLDTVPLVDAHTPGPTARAMAIQDLPLTGAPAWRPAPHVGVAFSLDCVGSGPTVLVVGGDGGAAVDAHLRACVVTLPEDEIGVAEGIATAAPYADRLAGGLVAAAKASDAVGVFAVGAWALPASATGLPFVVQDPLRRAADVEPARDPPWVHVPGAWWGVVDTVLADAVASGPHAPGLAAALARRLAPPVTPPPAR